MTMKNITKLSTRFLLAAACAAAMTGLFAASAGAASFEIAAFDGQTASSPSGGNYTQAGGHPYDITTSVSVSTHPATSNGQEYLTPDASPKDLLVDLPPGFMGNPTVLPTCSSDVLAITSNFVFGFDEWCPVQTQIGVITILDAGVALPVPLYNITPSAGTPARFGFSILNTSVILNGAVRGQGANLHLAVDTRNISQALPVYGAVVTFWGTPSDPAHDVDRCPGTSFGGIFAVAESPAASPFCMGEPGTPDGPHSSGLTRTPFLTEPTSCSATTQGDEFTLFADSWDEPGDFDIASYATHAPPGTEIEGELAHQQLYAPESPGLPHGADSCDIVPSNPNIGVQTTGQSAESPTGLDVSLDVPSDGLANPEGIGQSHLKKVVVKLPEGMTVNPSQGEGLGYCTSAQLEAEKPDPELAEGCPNDSKLGTVAVQTPLLEEPLNGAIYLAQPDDPATRNPGAENPSDSLLALYMVVRNAQRGVVITLAGKVDPDPRTGQLTTTFDELPQVPFSNFTLHFREGARSPLVTPQACGTYTTEAQFTPWSNPEAVVNDSSAFQITSGVGGGPCPTGGLPPFKPGLIAGSINNAAGHYSPFNVRLTRNDGEQEITHFSIKLPPGISGKLAGIPYCPDAALEAAKQRSGTEELAAPSCPAASEVGRTLVGAGVGSVLTYAPGKLYLAGPYHGAPISIAAITAAKVGPFDIGTVVVRQALRIDPETAEVFIDATGSDPIPHIIKGIVVHARDIRAYVDRSQFTLNPTSCKRTSTASTVLGSGLDFASPADDNPITVTSPFQAADCAALPFDPKLSLRLLGGTKRGAHPKLRAHLKMRGIGESAIRRAQVTLPHSEFLENAHIKTICTRVQFKAAGGNGAGCPAASVYGYAKATTPILDEAFTGPVFLRSSEHQLPDLVAALHSPKGFDFALVGRIDSVKGGGIRNTFEAAPDVPVTAFTLTMQGGGKGLLVNSTNLCKGTHRAEVSLDAHSGKEKDFRPALQVKCGKAKKKQKRAR